PDLSLDGAEGRARPDHVAGESCLRKYTADATATANCKRHVAGALLAGSWSSPGRAADHADDAAAGFSSFAQAIEPSSRRRRRASRVQARADAAASRAGDGDASHNDVGPAATPHALGRYQLAPASARAAATRGDR